MNIVGDFLNVGIHFIHPTVRLIAAGTFASTIYGLWLPLRHYPGLALETRDELVGITPFLISVFGFLFADVLLFYGNWRHSPALYLPFLIVNCGKITYDLIESIHCLCRALHFFRLSLSREQITEIIFFPSRIQWNHRLTAAEHFRIAVFLSVEIAVRILIVRIVWSGWKLLNVEQFKLDGSPSIVDIPTEEDNGSMFAEDEASVSEYDRSSLSDDDRSSSLINAETVSVHSRTSNEIVIQIFNEINEKIPFSFSDDDEYP